MKTKHIIVRCNTCKSIHSVPKNPWLLTSLNTRKEGGQKTVALKLNCKKPQCNTEA